MNWQNLLMLLLSLFSTTFTNDHLEGNLSLEIHNITKAEGQIMVAVYNQKEKFLEDGQEVVIKSLPVEKTGSITVSFPNLPFGKEYSIAVYHDRNGNNSLDTNIMGIPSEPYGFSNNARSKWGPPKYEIARFEMNQRQQNMVIQVKKWRKQ